MMKLKSFGKNYVIPAGILSLAVFSLPTFAEHTDHEGHQHEKEGKTNMGNDRKEASQASLNAKLLEPQKNSSQKAAVVEVDVQGVHLIDPMKTDGKPSKKEGHLHYQLDGGAVVATPSSKLSFHELSTGRHTIKVTLAGNDHQPLGPSETVTVTIP